MAVFDAETGAVRQVLTGHTGRAYCAGFSPDGARVAVGNWDADNTVRVWDVRTGEPGPALGGRAG